MNEKIAIEVKNISKRYRIGLKEELNDTLTAKAVSIIKSPLKNYKKLRGLQRFNESDGKEDVIWAVKDISFNVKAGEVLGVVGSNGAGKSTLLKLLAQITNPTSGSAILHGRVASLLEVGTGFHPDLTGRENTFLNGTILGMSKNEISEKFNQIIDFSGIKKFIDTPVKRYSSGMRVRLAFSVAAFLDPEILLIDEVLAVGDVDFQNKCLDKMEEISKSNRTILFVSHNLPSIEQLCSRAIFINQGQLINNGSVKEVITEYLSTSRGGDKNDSSSAGINNFKGNGKFFIKKVDYLINNKIIDLIQAGEDVTIRFFYEAKELSNNLRLIIKFVTQQGAILFTCLSSDSYSKIFELKSKGSIDLIIPKIPLPPGMYHIDVYCKYQQEICFYSPSVKKIQVVGGDYFGTGQINEAYENGAMGTLLKHSWKVN
tara:strand:- start:1505 stop:2791 length:1287 start_codon:yes stop_codon:yes gene_type:complete